MSTSPIGNLSNSYIQEMLANAVQRAGVSPNTAPSNTSDATSSYQSDSAQLSPFAQLASTLQQLQQSDPAEYKQVTAQIATNLLSASQTAQSEGNAGASKELAQLATDFTDASQTGQLPNLQDLAQAVGGGGTGGGGGHHHHRAEAAASNSSDVSSGSSGTSNSSGLRQALNQFLASLAQTSGSQTTQDASTNPATIILQTLANAGINVTAG